MMDSEPSPRADAIMAVILLLGSIGYFIVAGQEAAGSTRRDLLGQAGFPQALAAVGVACTLVILGRSVWRWRAERRQHTVSLRRAWQWRPWVLWGMGLLYVLTLRPIGFAVATPVLIFLGLLVIGIRRMPMAIGVAAGAAIALYLIFDVFLGVSLPAGVLIERFGGGG